MDVMDASVKTPGPASATVKSAQRVLEVLELFAERQSAATVTKRSWATIMRAPSCRR